MNFRLLTIATFVSAAAACSSEPPASTGTAGTPGVSGSGGVAAAGGGMAGSLAGGGSTPVGGGGAGGSGGSGGASGSGGGGGAPNLMPTKLSETGLFSDMKTQALAAGVYAYEPLYKLWSDAATKRRWVYLPPGSKITTDGTGGMEFWEYPAGFKLWKEFTRDNKVIETRLLLKKSAGLTDWYMVAFKWNDDHSDAIAVPKGEMNAMGTMHDIPAQEGCTGCHGTMYDNVLGFSALQLSHSLPNSLTLAQADQMGWFTKSPMAGGYALPGDQPAKDALGYLHANCGMCHNNFSKIFNTKTTLDLWAHLDQLGTVETTAAYLSMVCDEWPKQGTGTTPPKMCTAGHAKGAPMDTDISDNPRVLPHDASKSAVHELMNTRASADAMKQMPPIGTEDVDTAGVAAVDAWITSLPAP